MAKVATNINIDQDFKLAAQELFNSLGMDLSTAVNLFIRQAVWEQRIPFEIKRNTVNEETMQALAEYYEWRNNPHEYRTYDNFDDMLEDVLNEV